MPRTLLRTVLPLLVTAIVFSPSASFGRGPGGRGGAGGSRSPGGAGGHSRQLGNKELKKKDGIQAGGIGAGGLSDKLGGAQKRGGGPQILSGKFEKFPGGPGQLKNGAFDPAKFQAFDQVPGQSQNWQARDGQRQQTAQNRASDFRNGVQPFTAEWYADHPNAWQATHPHADAWAAATATGVAAWLGWGAYDNTPYGTSYSTTYVYEQPVEETDGAYDGNATDDSTTDDSAATEDDSDEWLALGVYAVESANGEPTSRYLQLNVNRQGEIRGAYYDEIAGSSQNLSGQVDQSTRVATWSPDANRQVTFRANLSDLTQASGTVEVTQPAGKQTWRINRLDQTGQ